MDILRVKTLPMVGKEIYVHLLAYNLLMRLRPNRCVFGAPLPYQGVGRPAKHGQIQEVI